MRSEEEEGGERMYRSRLLAGIGLGGRAGTGGIGGWRKGREPVGEAWFVEGERRCGVWERRRRVCDGRCG